MGLRVFRVFRVSVILAFRVSVSRFYVVAAYRTYGCSAWGLGYVVLGFRIGVSGLGFPDA